MLHILLGLLKIIGIILAVIIGVVLLIILVILFSSMRYELCSSMNGDVKTINADIKFSWLFHLITGYFVYRNEELDWQVRIAWKKINIPKDNDEEADNHTEDSVIQEIESVKDDAVQSAVVIDEVRIEEETEMKSEPDSTGKSEKKTGKKSNSKSTKKKYSTQKFSDKIKEISSWKDKILAYLSEETHKKAFHKLLKETLYLLKKLKPKKLNADVEFGFEDPYTTGTVLAYASMLYPFYGDNINLKPNFEESIIKGNVFLKGYMRISYFANMGIRLLLNKNIRLTIKDTMKLIAKK